MPEQRVRHDTARCCSRYTSHHQASTSWTSSQTGIDASAAGHSSIRDSWLEYALPKHDRRMGFGRTHIHPRQRTNLCVVFVRSLRTHSGRCSRSSWAPENASIGCCGTFYRVSGDRTRQSRTPPQPAAASWNGCAREAFHSLQRR